MVMKRVHLKYSPDRKRYPVVMQRVQLKYRIERHISEGHARVQLKYRIERDIYECNAKSAIEVQARERYIYWSCNGCN